MLTMTGVNRLLCRQVVPISWDIEPILIKTSGLPPALATAPSPWHLGETQQIGDLYNLRIDGEKIYTVEHYDDADERAAFEIATYPDHTDRYTFPQCKELVLTRNPVTRISTLDLPARLYIPEMTVDPDGIGYLIGSTRWEDRL